MHIDILVSILSSNGFSYIVRGGFFFKWENISWYGLVNWYKEKKIVDMSACWYCWSHLSQIWLWCTEETYIFGIFCIWGFLYRLARLNLYAVMSTSLKEKFCVQMEMKWWWEYHMFYTNRAEPLCFSFVFIFYWTVVSKLE